MANNTQSIRSGLSFLKKFIGKFSHTAGGYKQIATSEDKLIELLHQRVDPNIFDKDGFDISFNFELALL